MSAESKIRQNKHALLLILTLVGVMNFADRQIIAILVESIKEELSLTDGELGLLSGLYFALFYATLGIPVAMLADRWHRGRIIALSVFIWSAMTAISGFATSYLHLVLARLGVGMGEAGVAPASHSLLSQRFEPHERPTAFAIYSVGGTVGLLIALGGGGWINEHYGWRVAFILAGLPGLALALVAWFFIHEPRAPSLSSPAEQPASSDRRASIFTSFAVLWKKKGWRHAAIATGVAHVGTFGIGQFTPALLSRSYGLESSQVGGILAVIIGLGGSIGALSGGVVAGRIAARRGVSWLAWLPALAFLGAGVLALTALSVTSLPLLLALLTPYFVLALAPAGLQFAATQPMVPDHMRATSSALLILIVNLVGLTLGPLLVGWISDTLKPTYADDSLRLAMMAMTPFLAWGAVHYYLAGRALPSDVIDDAV